MALKEEFDRNENVYKHVAAQEAEERRLRDQELERMRLEWLEQMKVIFVYSSTLLVKGGCRPIHPKKLPLCPKRAVACRL